MRFRRLRDRSVARRPRARRRRAPTCAESPTAGSQRGVRLHRRRRRGRAHARSELPMHSPTSRYSPGAPRRRARSTPPATVLGNRWPTRSCWRPPASPASPTRRASSRWRGPRPRRPALPLSTLGTRSMEEVAAVSDGRKWFQLYMFADRGLVSEIRRARTPPASRRWCSPSTSRCTDAARARRAPRLHAAAAARARHLVDGALHPAWTWAFARAEPIRFANVEEQGRRRRQHHPSTSPTTSSRDGRRDLVGRHRLAARRVGPGRSWSRASRPSTTRCVPPTRVWRRSRSRTTVGGNSTARQRRSTSCRRSPRRSAGRVEIICDGGVRRGSDIVKAVALGAHACMARPRLPLRARRGGERGVDFVLDLFLADMRAGDGGARRARRRVARRPSSWSGAHSSDRVAHQPGRRTAASARGRCPRRRCRAGR